MKAALAPIVVSVTPPVVSRAKELADAYVEAYRIAYSATGGDGNAHFAALKAMELASTTY